MGGTKLLSSQTMNSTLITKGSASNAKCSSLRSLSVASALVECFFQPIVDVRIHSFSEVDVPEPHHDKIFTDDEMCPVIGLSRTTGHAIQALSCLNDSACECQQVADLARCSGVPKAYLAKILNLLSRRGLLMAKRGYRGGVALARSSGRISLLEIVETVEGTDWIAECLLGMDACEALTVCPTYNFRTRIRGEIIAELHAVTLADLIRCRRSKPRRYTGSCGKKAESRRTTLPVNS